MTPSHASSSGHDVDDPYSGFNIQEYVADQDEAPLPTQQTQQSQQPQATGIVIVARERNAPDRYTPSHYDRPPPLLGTTQFQLQPVGRRSVGECGAQGRMPIRVVGEATDSVWFVLHYVCRSHSTLYCSLLFTMSCIRLMFRLYLNMNISHKA